MYYLYHYRHGFIVSKDVNDFDKEKSEIGGVFIVSDHILSNAELDNFKGFE